MRKSNVPPVLPLQVESPSESSKRSKQVESPAKTVKFQIMDVTYTNKDREFLNGEYFKNRNGNHEDQYPDHEKEGHNSCRERLKRSLRKLKSHALDDFGNEDDDEEWSSIETPPYTSGESDPEDDKRFYQLKKEQQDKKVIDLWHRLKQKTIGSVRILRRFTFLRENIVMFGASRRIMVDIEEERVPLPFILLPDNKIRMAWNMVIVSLLLYTASFVPYRTSFIDDAPQSLTNWEWVVDALFSLDIIINFISAYEDNDKNIEVRWKKIAKTYIKTWFVFDVIAIIPFQLLGGQDESQLLAQ